MNSGQLTGWRYRDVARVLQHFGYSLVSQKGDHRTWKHPGDPLLLTVPDWGGEPLRQGYIRLVVRRIRKVTEED
jgi:predicted RNA binding protein YcfA (HicA-like mRNA interferase family)